MGFSPLDLLGLDWKSYLAVFATVAVSYGIISYCGYLSACGKARSDRKFDERKGVYTEFITILAERHAQGRLWGDWSENDEQKFDLLKKRMCFFAGPSVKNELIELLNTRYLVDLDTTLFRNFKSSYETSWTEEIIRIILKNLDHFKASFLHIDIENSREAQLTSRIDFASSIKYVSDYRLYNKQQEDDLKIKANKAYLDLRASLDAMITFLLNSVKSAGDVVAAVSKELALKYPSSDLQSHNIFEIDPIMMNDIEDLGYRYPYNKDPFNCFLKAKSDVLLVAKNIQNILNNYSENETTSYRARLSAAINSLNNVCAEALYMPFIKDVPAKPCNDTIKFPIMKLRALFNGSVQEHIEIDKTLNDIENSLIAARTEASYEDRKRHCIKALNLVQDIDNACYKYPTLSDGFSKNVTFEKDNIIKSFGFEWVTALNTAREAMEMLTEWHSTVLQQKMVDDIKILMSTNSYFMWNKIKNTFVMIKNKLKKILIIPLVLIITIPFCYYCYQSIPIIKCESNIASCDEKSLIKCYNIFWKNTKYNRAIPYLEKAATKGDAQACFLLGRSYHLGLGSNQDHEKALDWYRKAAKNGHPEALYTLGTIYEYGAGVTKDEAKAQQFYDEAKQKGYHPRK